MMRTSLLERHAVQNEPSRAGRFVLIGLIGIGCAGAAYFSMLRTEEPAPVTAAAADPPPPLPSPAPEPAAPPPVREPEPEVVTEAVPPSSRLEPILRVTSDVPGASVFLDRAYLGTTPFEAAEVPTGPHRLNVWAEGYESLAQSIEIGDEPISIDVRLLEIRRDEIRLDASVAVVHTHRFGSCSGRLRADLDGIHYETTDDDAFSISLAEIERHEIDYLAHTLTVTRRQGRTYNFTDELDNADALSVFHRAVEQARERLAASVGSNK